MTSKTIPTPYLNYGYQDGINDINHNRPRKWDNEGKCLSVSWKKFNGKMGKNFTHFNNEYIKGYSKAFNESEG